jgi:bifunctional UDP-N-acetylglucosamine pyrophosphorylase / glucosamine-1-phosphate N-acetyltransferase
LPHIDFMSLDVVILAAGKGTRMFSAKPKVLHLLAGRPLLSHVVRTARTLNPQHIVIVFGYGGEQVRQALGEDDLIFVEQEPQLGTGHAVQQALPHLTAQNTLVLYGDVPLIDPSTLQRALNGDAALLLITASPQDPTGYGRIVREGGEVRSIVEERDANDAQRSIAEINTGILAAPTAKLARWLPKIGNDNAQREFYLTDVVSLAVADGTPIRTAQPAALFEILGVNSKSQLAELERIYQRQQAARLLERGVTLADPARIDIRGELDCEADVTIDIDCVFEGKVTLERGASIGAHCVIKDAHIEADAQILPFCHIDGARVGAHARVGPYARLRPGTVLGAHAHVGNFVETKNTTLAEGSKANHLSYLGDATIGRNVNIGAGTITCNYDGANKYQTVIGDGAFIGSDSQLVAPVTVGAGATIGAGSTVTRDAPPDELTISRAKQVTVLGWKRPVKKPKGK